MGTQSFAGAEAKREGNLELGSFAIKQWDRFTGKAVLFVEKEPIENTT